MVKCVEREFQMFLLRQQLLGNIVLLRIDITESKKMLQAVTTPKSYSTGYH